MRQQDELERLCEYAEDYIIQKVIVDDPNAPLEELFKGCFQDLFQKTGIMYAMWILFAEGMYKKGKFGMTHLHSAYAAALRRLKRQLEGSYGMVNPMKSDHVMRYGFQYGRMETPFSARIENIAIP